jgi:hypothetical protein
VRPVGSRGDRHVLDPQGATDRYDPDPLLVFVDELADQRPSGSHSRAKKVVAALRISIVCPSSRFLRRSSRLSSLETPAASPASISAWRTHLRSVYVFIPSRPAIAFIAAHSES